MRQSTGNYRNSILNISKDVRTLLSPAFVFDRTAGNSDSSVFESSFSKKK